MRRYVLPMLLLNTPALADTAVNSATGADRAFAKYGLTGKGVIVAILDRGIDYTHMDFRNTNGTTRIRAMWDMSGQNLCATNNPAPAAYTEAQINAALAGGAPLAERDAVGHGTVTTGLAAGNGSAALPTSAQWAGIAPSADLVIVKVVSDGAPAHGTQAAEASFQGCYNQALDLAVGAATSLKEPIVALIDSGTQWGPIDGTSAVSTHIDQDFGLDKAGHVYIAASGDEGSLPNHGRAAYTSAKPASFGITKPDASTTSYMQAWYTGAAPANVTVTMSDGGSLTVAPGGYGSNAGITMYNYAPGTQFYPWTSAGPDRAVWIQIVGHSGAGSVTFAPTTSTGGTADLYADDSGVVSLTNALTPSRLTDYSATRSATVAGVYNVRTKWKDVTGTTQTLTYQGATGALWTFSSGGPTRDGRAPPNGGVDIATPGGNAFAAYGINTYWDTFTFNLAYGGNSLYGRHSATSAAAPILVGTVALMLQADPALTASQVRAIIHSTATHDSHTGSVPNANWGAGKLNVLGALDAVAALIKAVPAASPASLSFGTVSVGTTSPPKAVTLRNSGTAALPVTNIATTGVFAVAKTNCAASLAAGKSCAITVTFMPKAKGAATGSLTIKDVNGTSPQTVALTGTGG